MLNLIVIDSDISVFSDMMAPIISRGMTRPHILSCGILALKPQIEIERCPLLHRGKGMA